MKNPDMPAQTIPDVDPKCSERLAMERRRHGLKSVEVVRRVNQIVESWLAQGDELDGEPMMNTRTLAQWETGRNTPQIGMRLRALAQVYGQSVSWLALGEGDRVEHSNAAGNGSGSGVGSRADRDE